MLWHSSWNSYIQTRGQTQHYLKLNYMDLQFSHIQKRGNKHSKRPALLVILLRFRRVCSPAVRTHWHGPGTAPPQRRPPATPGLSPERGRAGARAPGRAANTTNRGFLCTGSAANGPPMSAPVPAERSVGRFCALKRSGGQGSQEETFKQKVEPSEHCGLNRWDRGDRGVPEVPGSL